MTIYWETGKHTAEGGKLRSPNSSSYNCQLSVGADSVGADEGKRTVKGLTANLFPTAAAVESQ